MIEFVDTYRGDPTKTHWVKIRLTYTNGAKRTPYKWVGNCICGWGCASWSWSREYDVIMSGQTREQWIEENGQPEGGAFPMALEHVGLLG